MLIEINSFVSYIHDVLLQQRHSRPLYILRFNRKSVTSLYYLLAPLLVCSHANIMHRKQNTYVNCAKKSGIPKHILSDTNKETRFPTPIMINMHVY